MQQTEHHNQGTPGAYPPPGIGTRTEVVSGSSGHDADAEALEAGLEALGRVTAQMRTVVVGQSRMLERLMCCVLGRGHALLEGVPGVAKTTTLATLARSIGGSFHRIQFTADLLPSDIVGTRVYHTRTGEFEIQPGPVFANFVLADEINRAPGKSQSAMLEAMAELQVTLAGTTMALPDPFMVLATQNPIESEGVFPLPEAQRDRFMMRISVPLPNPVEELAIVSRVRSGNPPVQQVATIEELVTLQRLVGAVKVPDLVADYMVRLVCATRDPRQAGISGLDGLIESGASPRATIAIDRAARALALMRNKTTVSCQEVYDVAYDCLNHRLVLSFDALAQGVSAHDVCAGILTTVPAPPGA